MHGDFSQIPVVDVGALVSGSSAGRDAVAAEIGRACRHCGFFYVVGHGVAENFDAPIKPIDPSAAVADDAHERWDRSSVHAFKGSYGEYLITKVSKVFPDLGHDVL